MKKNLLSHCLLLLLIFCLSSCEAIGAIFKAGVWAGIIFVIVIIALIIFVVTKLGNRKK